MPASDDEDALEAASSALGGEWSLTVRTGTECAWEATAMVSATGQIHGRQYLYRATGAARSGDASAEATAGLIAWLGELRLLPHIPVMDGSLVVYEDSAAHCFACGRAIETSPALSRWADEHGETICPGPGAGGG